MIAASAATTMVAANPLSTGSSGNAVRFSILFITADFAHRI
jgi:hypothetical protein